MNLSTEISTQSGLTAILRETPYSRDDLSQDTRFAIDESLGHFEHFFGPDEMVTIDAVLDGATAAAKGNPLVVSQIQDLHDWFAAQ